MKKQQKSVRIHPNTKGKTCLKVLPFIKKVPQLLTYHGVVKLQIRISSKKSQLLKNLYKKMNLNLIMKYIATK